MLSPSCPICTRPVARDQRYCLECGHRLAGTPHAPVPVHEAPPAVVPPPRVGRKTAAALLLSALGTGTLLGAAASPPASSLAAAPPAVIAAVAPPPPIATPAPAPTAAAAASSSLPDDVPVAAAAPSPVSTAAPAPAPAPPPASTASAPAPAPAPAPTPEPTPTPTPAPEGPPAKHVVVVSLTGQDAAHAFDPASTASYLAHDLPAQGTLLTHYRPVSSGALANGLELLAGAEPAPDDLPDDAPSLPGELADAARSWKAYVQGSTQNCSRSDRDPFTHIPGLQDCALNDVSLDGLEGDFSDTDLAPALAWVIPDACHDGSETACPGAPDGDTGLARADAWLREWIPKITASSAFADDGLLVVLFDGGGLADPPAGEDRPAVGAVVVSRFSRAGTTSDEPYDHLSLLRTLAGTFGVQPPGDAGGEDVTPFGRDVLSRSQNVRTSVTGR